MLFWLLKKLFCFIVQVKRYFLKNQQKQQQQKQQQQEQEERAEPKKFEDLYDQELTLCDNAEVSNNSFLLMYTPLGNVLFAYDFQKDLFLYYSDRSIPYRFLETVARNFVLKNHCCQLYNHESNNRFIYLGKLNNFSFLQTKDYTKQTKKKSYRDFLKDFTKT